ncbi:MAG: phenol hydroxylase [Comamonadaceae bacterium]|nr:MAG: phenol hydroxylase [Comamonadaceae bacterium]
MQAQRRTRLSLPTAAPALPTVDTSLRFVRVTERRTDGLVAFEFAIGWPELAVELLLPAPDFDEFCAANQVRRLDA